MPASAQLPSDALSLRAARDAAVVCDLSPLAILAIAGPDAAAFLHGQLSSDVKGLEPDTWHYTSFNSPKGRMLANFVLWREGDTDFRALLPADIAEPVRKRLSMYVLRSKVTLTDVSQMTVRLGVGGPKAAAAVHNAFGAAPRAFAVNRADAIAVLGLAAGRFVVLAPAAGATAARDTLGEHARDAPFAVWQWLTIRAGVPVITAATQDQFIAQAANWDTLGGVNFQKGCYTGQEIIARAQYLGRLKERLYAFHAAATDVEPGTRLYSMAFGDQPCGTVVNAAAAPGGGCDLLAVLQIAAAEAGDVRLRVPDGTVLLPQPLPYTIPEIEAPRGRSAPQP